MEGNIGYLRIKGWNEDAFQEVATWMPQMPGTEGLIIDIRHNRGGTRNVLRELYPYFVSDADKPRVANPARYRLYHEFGPDHLDSRNMHLRDWPGWSWAERIAIAELMETFTPEWDVPSNQFSDWHFWVLTKAPNPHAYDYTRPIVFLMDQQCFSASDVILSTVKGMANVTLIGERSRGGSGAYVRTTLTNSGLSLRLSSMASFQTSGRLFDGVGVEPDIYLEPDPEYYILNGPDKVLELAVRLILGEASASENKVKP
jgi:C-terminal processing protease CtpA/Prc